MTIREANILLKNKEIDLEYYLSKKEEQINKMLPKPIDNSKITVDGGKREDKYFNYIIECEELDNKIEILNNEIFRLRKLIDEKLKIINEYEPLKSKIVNYRENLEKPLEWWRISQLTGYSERHCQRLYSEAIGKRCIDE